MAHSNTSFLNVSVRLIRDVVDLFCHSIFRACGYIKPWRASPSFARHPLSINHISTMAYDSQVHRSVDQKTLRKILLRTYILGPTHNSRLQYLPIPFWCGHFWILNGTPPPIPCCWALFSISSCYSLNILHMKLFRCVVPSRCSLFFRTLETEPPSPLFSPACRVGVPSKFK